VPRLPCPARFPGPGRCTTRAPSSPGFRVARGVSQWPRIHVPRHFLHALVFAPGVRKTISITATALSTAAAMVGTDRGVPCRAEDLHQSI